MRYSILTPTILRGSLLKACESINNQTCTDWEHIVIVDSDLRSDILNKITHPQRRIVYCDTQHGDYGHSCRHHAYKYCKGDYIYNLDDDNYLSDENVLEDLKIVFAAWAVFPILDHDSILYSDPPKKLSVDTGSILVRRDIGQWPLDSSYDADGKFIEELVRKHNYQPLGDMRPLMTMPISKFKGLGKPKAGEKAKISIFTPTHTGKYLQDVYESIKDQDFHEWIVVYNNGAVPTNFEDDRVKSHILYKSPEKVGALKAFACEQATGNVLLELDHDDILMPDAIAEVQKAFEDPEVGFVYSNAIHAFEDFKKYPRFDENFGWKYREIEYKGHKLDEFVSFPPNPDAVSRIWYAPDHLRAFRVNTYRRVGGYDKSMKILDDSDLMCRMYIHTKFKHIDKPLYIYRVHGNNSWLRFNKEIQDNVYPIYDKYIGNIVGKWADDKNLLKLEIGQAIPKKDGYTYLSIEDANKDRWPIADNSVAVILTVDSLAMIKDPLKAMKEISRVLVPGGWLLCQVPSTDGRGAWQDPRHISYWNQNSFLYYTNKNWAQYINTPVRFQAPRLYTTEKNDQQVCWVIAHLINLKGGYRPPGDITI